jgi:feruloyl esterase
VPGLGHCGGGDGCCTFEKLGTMDEWVDKGKAPDQIVASKVIDGKVIRTRPLSAYPWWPDTRGQAANMLRRAMPA